MEIHDKEVKCNFILPLLSLPSPLDLPCSLYGCLCHRCGDSSALPLTHAYAAVSLLAAITSAVAHIRRCYPHSLQYLFLSAKCSHMLLPSALLAAIFSLPYTYAASA
jgi:hypothetical protein